MYVSMQSQCIDYCFELLSYSLTILHVKRQWCNLTILIVSPHVLRTPELLVFMNNFLFICSFNIITNTFLGSKRTLDRSWYVFHYVCVFPSLLTKCKRHEFRFEYNRICFSPKYVSQIIDCVTYRVESKQV